MAASESVPVSHPYLFAAFQDSPVALAVTRDGVFIDVNEAFTRLTGWLRDDVVGRVAREFGLVSPDDAITLRADLDRDNQVRDRAVTLFARDRSPRDVLLGVSVVLLDGRRYVISTLVDLTHQRRVERELRASEERVRLITETISEVFWIADVFDSLLVCPRMNA